MLGILIKTIGLVFGKWIHVGDGWSMTRLTTFNTRNHGRSGLYQLL